MTTAYLLFLFSPTSVFFVQLLYTLFGAGTVILLYVHTLSSRIEPQSEHLGDTLVVIRPLNRTTHEMSFWGYCNSVLLQEDRSLHSMGPILQGSGPFCFLCVTKCFL